MTVKELKDLLGSYPEDATVIVQSSQLLIRPKIETLGIIDLVNRPHDLTDSRNKTIITNYANGSSMAELSREFNLTYSTINRILMKAGSK